MNRFLKYIRSHPYLSFFYFLCLLVISAVIFQILTPKKEKVVSAYPLQKVTSEVAVDFSRTQITSATNTVTTPEYFEVPSVQIQTVTANQLALALGLSPTNQKNTWTDSLGQKVLTQDPYTARFSYSNNSVTGDFDSALLHIINIDRAAQIATQYLHQQLKIQNLQPDMQHIIYFQKNATHPDEVAPEKANQILIPYTAYINGYSVKIGTEAYAPLNILVDSADNINGFTMSAQQFTAGNTIRVKSLSASQIANQIQTGRATIIKAVTSDASVFNILSVTELKISSLEIEYRVSKQDQIIIPVYHVVGVAKIANTAADVAIEVTVPAIINSN